jgi:hypothetical protein
LSHQSPRPVDYASKYFSYPSLLLKTSQILFAMTATTVSHAIPISLLDYYRGFLRDLSAPILFPGNPFSIIMSVARIIL